MIRRYYTVYEEKSETIIAYGTAEECAGQLNIKRSSFIYALSRQQTKRIKKPRRYIVVERLAEDTDMTTMTAHIPAV